MTVLVLGRDSRYAGLLHSLGTDSGLDMLVSAVDAADLTALHGSIATSEADLVINCVARTSVSELEVDPGGGVEANLLAAELVAWAAYRAGLQCVYVSTDYARGPWTRYGRQKAEGERRSRRWGAAVARIAIAYPDEVERYTWLNGATHSHREWAEDSAARLLKLLPHVSTSALYEVGPPEPTTLADLVLARFPDHPGAVERNIYAASRRAGVELPRDTTFERVWTGG